MYRALRRHYNVKKALRKRNIARRLYSHEYYDNLHQYSDNKIHCSCCMCSFRSKLFPNAKTAQDVRIIARMDDMEKEYKRETA